jgi:hypothetical protein
VKKSKKRSAAVIAIFFWQLLPNNLHKIAKELATLLFRLGIAEDVSYLLGSKKRVWVIEYNGSQHLAWDPDLRYQHPSSRRGFVPLA